MKKIVKRLLGIELNLDVLILIILWHLNYKPAFWVLLVLCVINALIASYQIERGD